MWRRVLPFGVCLLVVACGGRAVGSGDEDPEGGDSTPDPTGKGSKDDDIGSDNPDADTDLGSCKLGPVEDYSSPAPCAWVADKRCYTEREMACNCACPRSRNSQCSSGFDAGPDGHVWVSCN